MLVQSESISEETPERVRTVERWRPYLIESSIVLGGFALFSQLTQHMPLVVIALVWAALSTLTAVGATYQYTIAKQYKQVKYKVDTTLARLNKGRLLCFTVSFLVSAACMLMLILQSPLWSWSNWLIVLLAIPLYRCVAAAIDKTSGRQMEDDYRPSHVFWWSVLLTALLLGIGYAVAADNAETQQTVSFAETFCSVEQPFERSGVALFSEAGAITRFMNAFQATEIEAVSTLSPEVCFILRIVLQFAPLASIAGLLGVCGMPKGELLRAFQTLKENNVRNADVILVKKYALFGCIAPIMLVVLCFALNANTGLLFNRPLYQSAKSIVHEEILSAACEYEGKYYDRNVVKELVAVYENQLNEITDEAAPNLTNLINDAFNKRKENVDSFLSKCYESENKRYLPSRNGEYSEEELRGIYVQILNEGVDDTALKECLEEYRSRISSVEQAYEAELATHELRYVPDWLQEADTEKDAAVFDELENRIVALDSVAANLGGYAGENALSPETSKTIFDTVASIPQWIIDQLINRNSDRDKIKEAIEAEREKALKLLSHLGEDGGNR